MDTKQEIRECLSRSYEEMPIIQEISKGNVEHEDLQKYALIHYAEIKTFINIKIPARMYLCPHEARHAKHYFCYLYEEEQGNFREGENHADLFKPVCYELGITRNQMDEAFDSYSTFWLHLLNKERSYKTMVHELAVSVAWESFTPFYGESLIEGLSDYYGLSDEAIKYFEVHSEVDEAHSARAIDTLSRYCTNEELLQVAKDSIQKTLITRLHLKDPHGSIF